MIADVNHDGTSGTVDLFSKYVLFNTNYYIAFAEYNSSNIYKDSKLDYYLRSSVYDGFATEVKNALNCMDVASNGEVLQRYIVAPSLIELGFGSVANSLNEGYIYPIFSPASYTSTNYKCAFKLPTGSGEGVYYTRSRCTDDSNNVFWVNGGGSIYPKICNDIQYSASNIVARIRFAKA